MKLFVKIIVYATTFILAFNFLQFNRPFSAADSFEDSLPLAADKTLTPREWLWFKGAKTEYDARLLDRIAWCESRWQNICRIGGTDCGYFQIIASTERLTPQFAEGKSRLNPQTNVEMALWLFYEGGGIRHWNPSRSCWQNML